MRTIKSAALAVLLSVTLLLAAAPRPQKPDPPLPDAKAFCHTKDDTAEAVHCTCADANEGTLCQSDEPYPRWCKRMCGHSRDCACCGLKK